MRVALSRSAADFLRKEVLYLKRRNQAAAAALVLRIREAMKKLESFPDMGHEGPALPVPGARTWVVGDYLLDYSRSDDILLILSIRHGRMRPPAVFPGSDDETDFDA